MTARQDRRGRSSQARPPAPAGSQPQADARRQPDPTWDRVHDGRLAFRPREFLPGFLATAAGAPAPPTVEPRDDLYARGGSSRRLRPLVREAPRPRRRPFATPEAADVAGWCGDGYGPEEGAGDAAAWCGTES